MKEFTKVDKVFIKSNNSVNKIQNRYLYSLIPFIIFTLIYNLIWGSKTIIISTITSIIISIFSTTITELIFNIKNRKTSISKILLDEQIITIGIIIGLFSSTTNIIITLIASIITIIIKNITKTTSINASLYGILLILVAKYYLFNLDTPLINLTKLSYSGTYNEIISPYGNITSYLLGTTSTYLSPILSIITFIYLFNKKSIKYNIVFSYILTIIFIMLFLGIFNNMNIWYLFFQLTTGNMLFLSVFLLPDYKTTPTTEEGQRIYGIITATITCILRFIIPELSVIISIILGSLLLTRLLNNISFKLKYQKIYYYTILTISILIATISTLVLNTII